MYQVIARKYRPQTFQDVVNQEHVKTTLENAIARNASPTLHFFGTARHWQTTVARILARCLNCVEGPPPRLAGVRELAWKSLPAALRTSSKSTPP